MFKITVVILVSFVICALCIVIFPVQSFAEERFFEIRAKKFSYSPNIIKVNKKDLVRIRLVSEDVHHGFFLDGYGVKTSAHPGQEGSLLFTANRTGRFSFRCSVTCGEFHPYMVGYMIVEPNSRFYMYVCIALLFFGINLSWSTFRKKRASDGEGQTLRAD